MTVDYCLLSVFCAYVCAYVLTPIKLGRQHSLRGCLEKEVIAGSACSRASIGVGPCHMPENI
jgi:hypothetical protein